MQLDRIATVFESWHNVIRQYRGSDEDNFNFGQNEKEDSDKDLDGTETQDQQTGGNQALFDVLAESITKLIAQRPAISSELSFGKQELLSSTVFVDYDRIDVVEQDDQENGQLLSSTELESTQGTELDTLNSQSRVTSKDQYLGQHFNVLENFEQLFEQQLVGDTYQTVRNAFKI